MKKRFSASIFFAVCLILSACSKSQVFVFSQNSEKTIFSEFAERKVLWEDELEGDSLIGESPRTIKLNRKINLVPVSYAVFVANKSESLYPFLEGFGSLDISSFNVSAKKTVDGFCRAFCAEEKLEEFVEKIHLSSLVFFYADVEQLSGPKKGDEKRFSDYIYGKPFESDDSYGVPVCFYRGKNQLTVFLYLNKQDWKINQIQIKKWQVN